jgi:hypothetical protein
MAQIMATRPTKPTPAVPEVAENCGHGTPKLLGEDARVAAVKGYLERHEKQYREFKAKYQGQELRDHHRERMQSTIETFGDFLVRAKAFYAYRCKLGPLLFRVCNRISAKREHGNIASFSYA